MNQEALTFKAASRHYRGSREKWIKVSFIPSNLREIDIPKIINTVKLQSYRPRNHKGRMNADIPLDDNNYQFHYERGCWNLYIRFEALGSYVVAVIMDTEQFFIHFQILPNKELDREIREAYIAKNSKILKTKPKVGSSFTQKSLNMLAITTNERWDFEELDEIFKQFTKKQNPFLELLRSETRFFQSSITESQNALSGLYDQEKELNAYWFSLQAALFRTANDIQLSIEYLHIALQMANGVSAYVIGDIHYNLALAYHKEGNIEMVKAYFNDAAKAFFEALDGLYPTVYSNLLCRTWQRFANIMIELGYLMEADCYLQRAKGYERFERTEWQLNLTELDYYLAKAATDATYIETCYNLLSKCENGLNILKKKLQFRHLTEGLREEFYLNQRRSILESIHNASLVLDQSFGNHEHDSSSGVHLEPIEATNNFYGYGGNPITNMEQA